MGKRVNQAVHKRNTLESFINMEKNLDFSCNADYKHNEIHFYSISLTKKSDITVSNFGEDVRIGRAYPVHLLMGERWRQASSICCSWTHPCLGQVIHICVCILEEVWPTDTRMLVQDRGSSCVGASSHWELIYTSISWRIDRLWTVNMLGHISENMLEMNKSTWKTSHCRREITFTICCWYMSGSVHIL